ncbi:MAG TPA: ABC transporter permease [Candidatus Thalassarchaeaceae archaeon]|jgi:ABC-type transport system involved in multi-copper enzyme maturation permease subunit|nr:ABC transporter permease [Candidatus Thalassarchaeaceae archaeon]|tara:strand:+ start:10423 stop:12165 length:1743 start_codon:yes stop_codon:yes gene_type:complete
MDKKGLDLADTVWTKLDRKAGAIVELTVRQLAHRVSTWVVFGTGVLLMALLLAFYIDSVRESFEPIDNDGDSVDYDGDGYPLGQERKYGTSDSSPSEFPGSPIYVKESDIDWNDLNRVFYGNKSWQGIAFFEASWIDYSFTGNWDEDIVDWKNDSNGNPRVAECPPGVEPWELYEGNACEIGDEDGDGLVTYLVNGNWIGEGEATVPDQYHLNWGQVTEGFHVEPDPQEMYIDEDGIDCFDSSGTRVDCPAGDRLSGSHGFDDDGDCLREGWVYPDGSPQPQDPESEGYLYYSSTNGNGIPCDIIWIAGPNGLVSSIQSDENVDEDPDDEAYAGELGHRTFIIGVGKIAFVILLGLFIPLFLALGLVRDETENGTLHLLLSKPIHRAEFILYRLLGYLAVSAGYVLALSLLVGTIAAAIGPGEGVFRVSDLPVWLGIGIATSLVLAAYGAMFNTMGLISPKYGVYVCILFGIWEFVMGTFSIINPNWMVSSISITHWALQMIDAIVLMAWPDTIQWAQIGQEFGINDGLSAFWKPPVHTLGASPEIAPVVALLTSAVVLLSITMVMLFIGKSVFSRREIM